MLLHAMHDAVRCSKWNAFELEYCWLRIGSLCGINMKYIIPKMIRNDSNESFALHLYETVSLPSLIRLMCGHSRAHISTFPVPANKCRFVSVEAIGLAAFSLNSKLMTSHMDCGHFAQKDSFRIARPERCDWVR